KNNILQIYRPDPQTGKVISLLSTNVFGILRAISQFRLPGSTKDVLIATSDSGRISILEYNTEKNLFEKVHQETFGKSGIRRLVPGQFLASDPKGRAVMLSAAEKHKLVYILNRDSEAKMTINSPLEANTPNVITFALIGVDVGYENPIFASIEVDFTDSDQDSTNEAFLNIEKNLVYYELDLGLNHVVRKWSQSIELTANLLIPLPGGGDGPSGVLVCSENYITWVHQNFKSQKIPIPKRPNLYQSNKINSNEGLESKIIITNYVVHKIKKKKEKHFFILLQTELGDLFKLTCDYEKPNLDGSVGGGVTNLKIKYFDTIPLAGSICLLKSGFLFAASELGNHYLYQIEQLGDDDDTQTEYNSQDLDQEKLTPEFSIYFNPRSFLNISPVDELESLSPILDAKVANLAEEDTPQIYVVCGTGARSSFRVLRHGLECSEIAISELPGNPNSVWTCRAHVNDPYDSFIVVSFVNATLVLSISESGVDEVTDTGFLGSTPTLLVALVGEDSLVQIYPQGIRHIRSDQRVSEWPTPSSGIIVQAACNQKQVAIALSSGELVYFELDNSGNLNEFQDRKEMSSPVTALGIGPVPEGRIRSNFLAVGCEDNTVRVFSLAPETCLNPINVQAVQSTPESITITAMQDSEASISFTQHTLFMHVGLQNGVLLRSTLDSVTGSLSDTRSRFIGTKPCKLFQVRIGCASSTDNPNAVLILSSRPWLAYIYQGRTKLVPISYEALEFGSSFSSENCPEGIVAVSGNVLRILQVEKLGNVFNQGVVPLNYTPRRIALNQSAKNFVIIESDHGVICSSEKKALLNGGDIADIVELPEDQFGLPKHPNPSGKWVSCVRLMDPFQGEILTKFDLDNNEAAFSVSVLQFNTSPGVTYAVVGTAKDVTLSPRSCASGYLRTYKFIENGNKLEFVHITPIEEVPQSIYPFQGRMLVGMGKSLRIYDLGKKKMLRKCELSKFPNLVVNIQTQGDRIIVSDVQEGVFYCKYLQQENRIVIFADESLPRWMTCQVMLDYDTVCGGDKFGNIFVSRLPRQISDEADDDPTGSKMGVERNFLNGALHKVQHVCEYHVGEAISSVHRTVLVPGGREVILYTTFLGKIGILIPFITKDDVEFFTTLEMHLRQENSSLVGRDHLSFRSSSNPCRSVVDGDLCEVFNLLPPEKRRAIAEGLDRTSSEVSKKLEDIR
ncbi:Splicing factor 3B subunit 3, partial [Clydaea vesicula]